MQTAPGPSASGPAWPRPSFGSSAACCACWGRATFANKLWNGWQVLATSLPRAARLLFQEHLARGASVQPSALGQTRFLYVDWCTCRFERVMHRRALTLNLLGLLGCSDDAAMSAQAWKTYNRSALDFNLFFCSRTSQQLEAALPTDEAACLQLVWRKGQDDWTTYLHSHFDQIRYLHFRQESYKPILKN